MDISPPFVSDNEDFRKIIEELNFEDIKNEDDLIKYVIRIYGDQWKYRIYKPRWIYVFWGIYFMLLLWIVYIGMNAGATGDWVIRKAFHDFWIIGSNIIYLYTFTILTPGIIYPFLRTCRFKTGYSILCILYHIIPSTGILYSIIHYFMKGSLFQKQWFFSVLKLNLSILIIPFTFYIGAFIGSILS